MKRLYDMAKDIQNVWGVFLLCVEVLFGVNHVFSGSILIRGLRDKYE